MKEELRKQTEKENRKNARNVQRSKPIVKAKTPKPPAGAKYRQREGTGEEQEAQRRQQALEAMQLLEQRRQRMNQELLAEEIDQLSISPTTKDNSAQIEKKRLEAKKLKERRVLAFITEQELRKKEIASRKTAHPSPVTRSMSASFHGKPRCGFKPKVYGPKYYVKPFAQVTEEIAVGQPIEVIISECQPNIFIRYSKDEIRSLNPYGYYSM